MADEPQDRDRDDDPDAQNPFAGTPMEQIFRAMSGPGGQGIDLGAAFAQMQQMFSGGPHDGPVDFAMARDVARHALAAAGPDPAPHSRQQGAVADAVRLAESWLDRATDVPAGAVSAAAWSRAEWVEATAETWQQLVEPIAEHVVGAMAEAIPEEAKAMAGPLIGLLNQAGGAMFAQQIGRALAELAGEVHSSTDVGIPLASGTTAALLPTNVAAFGEGLEHSAADVMLYLTLRECAHLRLFRHAAWLRPALVGAVEEFGRGTRIDVGAIEAQLQGLDPTRLDQISEALSGGLFEPQRTPEQQVALDRLETMLAFVEGWVDDVVAEATRDTMPTAPALAEAIRRRRATGGPAEQTFASLVGLELRPRRMRDAANLWAAVRDRRGPQARDAAWSHPDLMPTAADLDDPLGFATENRSAADDADFTAALDELLDSAQAEHDETPDDER